MGEVAQDFEAIGLCSVEIRDVGVFAHSFDALKFTSGPILLQPNHSLLPQKLKTNTLVAFYSLNTALVKRQT